MMSIKTFCKTLVSFSGEIIPKESGINFLKKPGNFVGQYCDTYIFLHAVYQK